MTKENTNSEKIAMRREGINVKRPNDIIYLRLAKEPLTLILFFIEFFISIKISIKNISKKIIFRINTVCKFCSFNSIKLLSMNVRKVIKDKKRVKKNIIIIKKFLFMNVSINYEYI